MSVFKKSGSGTLSIKEAIENIQEISKEISSCKKCGKCQSVCPVYRETGIESYTSRGKLSLLKGLGDNYIFSSKELEKRLKFCLLCGRCKDECPQNINSQILFIKTRLLMADLGGKSILKRMIIRLFILFPGFRFLLKDGKRSFKESRPRAAEKKRVIFFSGCLFDKIYSEKKSKALAIFKKLGYKTELVDGECCGIPMLTSGDYKGYLKARNKLYKRFSKIDSGIIVSGCPTCISTLKKIWPKTGNTEDNPGEIFEIRDFHDFFHDNLKGIEVTKINKRDKGLVWHQPCHLKALGLDGEPLSIIEKFSGEKLKREHHINRCCGFGGTFSFDHPVLSSKMGKKRVEELKMGKDVDIVTGCPACMMQLGRSSLGPGFDKVLHTIDIVADNLDNFTLQQQGGHYDSFKFRES